MPGFGRSLFVVVMLAALAPMWGVPAVAQERRASIRLLGVEAVGAPVAALAADFARESGHRVAATIAAPEAVMEKIAANEVHDVVIVGEPAMDRLDREGIINTESRTRLVSDGTTVYEGAILVDGAEPEAVRAFLNYLASPEARVRWVAAQLEPLPDH
jgi:ABC-type molybdate transport system substrate-binding protein